MMRVRLGVLAVSLGLLLISGCTRQPLTLSLAVQDTYARETACACIHYLASREYSDLVNILRKEHDIHLKLHYVLEEPALEAAIRKGRFDGAICKPWFALQYENLNGLRMSRVADLVDPFDNTLLSGIFIVPKESPIQKPGDITGKRLVMGKKNSYEKYHLAMRLLEEQGVKPAWIGYKEGCTDGINALLDHEADVAVISDYALVATCAVDFAGEEAFRTILKTEDIPLCSVIVDRKKVSRSDARRLKKALLEITAKGMPASFASRGFTEPLPWNPEPFVEQEK